MNTSVSTTNIIKMVFTLNASLRWNSSLAISSLTQLGMSGIAIWMTYFSSTAKCCSGCEPEKEKDKTKPKLISVSSLMCPQIKNIKNVSSGAEHTVKCSKLWYGLHFHRLLYPYLISMVYAVAINLILVWKRKPYLNMKPFVFSLFLQWKFVFIACNEHITEKR